MRCPDGIWGRAAALHRQQLWTTAGSRKPAQFEEATSDAAHTSGVQEEQHTDCSCLDVEPLQRCMTMQIEVRDALFTRLIDDPCKYANHLVLRA